MNPVCIALATALLAAGDPDLTAAEKAFAEGLYDEVLPRIEKALARTLQRSERLRAHELAAMTYSAFEKPDAAVREFRRALGVDPEYAPDPSVSPKIRALYTDAKAKGPIGIRPSEATGIAADAIAGGPPAARATARGAMFKQWWFWAGVGAVAIGAGASVAYLTRLRVPPGKLGTGQLNP